MSDEKTGYPPQNPAYSPGYQHPSAYPPPQQGYPAPPNPAYPPQQGGYPPQPAQLVTSPQQPGQTVIIRQTQVQPSDYLGFAIFVTICCCLPFGIVGIIKSLEVRSLFISGEYQRAEDSSRSAKKWSLAGLVTGLIIIVSSILLYILLNVIVGVGVAVAAINVSKVDHNFK